MLGRNTVIPPDRETWDLICAYLAGEMSEGRLTEVLHARLGWDRSHVRAAHWDAVERGKRLCEQTPSPKLPYPYGPRGEGESDTKAPPA